MALVCSGGESRAVPDPLQPPRRRPRAACLDTINNGRAGHQRRKHAAAIKQPAKAARHGSNIGLTAHRRAKRQCVDQESSLKAVGDDKKSPEARKETQQHVRRKASSGPAREFRAKQC
jgi:hypothetical protein